MSRPKKSTVALRRNGAKASNKGKITSGKVAVTIIKKGTPTPGSSITFETVFRSKLHKKIKYSDELRAQQLLVAATQVVEGVGQGKQVPEEAAGMSCERARGISLMPIRRPRARNPEDPERGRPQHALVDSS